MTACSATRLMSKRVHTTLGAQMRVGAGLEIVFLVMRGGLVLKVVVGHAIGSWVARAALRAVTTWALRAWCAVVRWSCAMRRLPRVGVAGRALRTSG